MWLGLQTVSSLQRRPLFRVSFIERSHCTPFFHYPYLHLIHQVLKVLSVEDKEMYALKVVSLTNSAMEEALANEVRILKKLQGHPQIVQLKEL